MKLDEVPQDKKYLIEGKISDLTYAVDKDGNYTSTQSLGWQPKNEAMSMAWDLVYEQTENVRKLVLEDKLSPIAFYKELNIMDVPILASYTGFSKWRVRRHLKMKYFKNLKPEIIAKYAKIFDLSSVELMDMKKIREMKLKHED